MRAAFAGGSLLAFVAAALAAVALTESRGIADEAVAVADDD
jgi:hypothetical protein